ncbi:MAG: YunC family protein [Candidatus Bathyarchaeia archaeon]
MAVVVERLLVGGKPCLGVRVDLPNSPPLLVVVAERGFVMCGFLNVDVAERLGVAAAVVSGVKSFEDVLNGEVKVVTRGAEALGVKVGMKGAEALKCMF